MAVSRSTAAATTEVRVEVVTIVVEFCEGRTLSVCQGQLRITGGFKGGGARGP